MRRTLAALLTTAFLATTLSSARGDVAATPLPNAIASIMHKPRYAHASWSLLVTDLDYGSTIYALEPDRLAFTGSVRKLFSVGVTLDGLGADHRFRTPVYRAGAVDPKGTLTGDLILVGAGDLTLGSRLASSGTVAFTNFDHNDANNLGTAILTSQNPLAGLDELARQVRASGIKRVSGDVIVDDRLFESYRVPNGNLLVTPILVNENMVDVTVAPTRPGQPARVDWRPKTAAFRVAATVQTVAAGKPEEIDLSGKGLMQCDWRTACVGTVHGTIPVDYKAPLSNESTFVRTFRVEDPASFARIAFMQALQRAGVTVRAPLLRKNSHSRLPARGSYMAKERVAEFVSAPYAQIAKLVLKVSLNLGANLSLSLFGVAKGTRTIAGSLAAERQTLEAMGLNGRAFNFPTNGSGSPDSQAAPQAVVQLLGVMAKTSSAAAFHAALPVLGVDGSLAGTGVNLPARGHVFAKTGTTVEAGALKAQVLAGYIDAKSGRKLGFALFVNDAGPLKQIADVGEVFADEAEITNVIYESN